MSQFPGLQGVFQTCYNTAIVHENRCLAGPVLAFWRLVTL